jgi:Zinc-binding dehydrogenase
MAGGRVYPTPSCRYSGLPNPHYDRTVTFNDTCAISSPGAPISQPARPLQFCMVFDFVTTTCIDLRSGCGPLGCMVLAVAQAFGLSKILAFDVRQNRIDFAKSYGADYVAIAHPPEQGQDPGQWAEAWKALALKEAGIDPWGVDVVVEASGAESSMHAGMAFLHSGGTCEHFSVLPHDQMV